MLHDNFFAIFATPWFLSSFLSWMIAQAAKLVAALVTVHRVDFRYFVSTGGMPSAHSAMVTGLAVSVGLTEGFESAPAMIAAAFAAVTMFDAANVRRAAGQQAAVLNQIIDELFRTHRLSEARLKELLGHTRLEVFCGLIIGFLTALGVCASMR
ncbi:MAG: divergent PAP2 family protein [Kiritimatiellaeota bacterium]|nr:divergent PAP2 family protein [Kiritimatiellota bacterium]